MLKTRLDEAILNLRFDLQTDNASDEESLRLDCLKTFAKDLGIFWSLDLINKPIGELEDSVLREIKDIDDSNDRLKRWTGRFKEMVKNLSKLQGAKLAELRM